eukprot:scaffold844_cov254-Pinguiococcus_pyrenoidosus.AAC.4
MVRCLAGNAIARDQILLEPQNDRDHRPHDGAGRGRVSKVPEIGASVDVRGAARGSKTQAGQENQGRSTDPAERAAYFMMDPKSKETVVSVELPADDCSRRRRLPKSQTHSMRSYPRPAQSVRA